MTNLEYFINKYRKNDLLIDANLFMVLLVGSTSEEFISKVKPTRTYTKEDYRLLIKLIKNFNLVTTSHILAETSNLCEKIEKYYREKIFRKFADLALNLAEIPMPVKEATSTPVFLKFGLTDAVIFKLAKKGLVILTDDFNLHSYIVNNGATAANINFFRGEYLLS